MQTVGEQLLTDINLVPDKMNIRLTIGIGYAIIFAIVSMFFLPCFIQECNVR